MAYCFHGTFTICLLAAVHGFLISMASANEQIQDDTWNRYSFFMTYSGDMFTDRQKAKVEKGEAIYTTRHDKAGLQFDCVAGKFRAGLTLKPQSVRAAFQEIRLLGTRYGKGKIYIDMELNGDIRVSLGRWAYDKKEQSAKSLKRKPAAKLYNAIVRKDKVRLLIEGRAPIELQLPKPNQEFAEFGAECGIGKLAKRQKSGK